MKFSHCIFLGAVFTAALFILTASKMPSIQQIELGIGHAPMFKGK